MTRAHGQDWASWRAMGPDARTMRLVRRPQPAGPQTTLNHRHHDKEGNRMKKAIALALVLGTAAMVAATAVAQPSGTARAAAGEVSCSSAKIGFMGPITGDAAFIGKEQLGFGKEGIRKHSGGA